LATGWAPGTMPGFAAATATAALSAVSVSP
jgi:hypothetical protein